MIRNYRDHAANERTYLAWIRTALALMGFGLLIERFDLFVQTLAGATTQLSDAAVSTSSDIASTFLILLGVLVLGISSSRYLRFKRYIASDEAREFDAAIAAQVDPQIQAEPLSDGESEPCPACGAEVPAEVSECPDCGLTFGV